MTHPESGTPRAPRACVTHSGIYVRGATTAITRRTTMRKAFLAPWHPLVEQFGLWFLAKAQQDSGVAIHSSHFVINHHHTDVTPSDADGIPRFTRVFHGELSCALNTLLLHEKDDAPGEVFDDRSTHRMRLLDAAAQASQHIYGLNNTTAAGLVARPDHMPSLALSHRHWRGGPLVIERPPLYVDPRTNPAQLELHVTPPPELYRAFDGDLDALVHHLDRLGEHGRKCIRDARRGRAVLGAKEVQRIHPWSEPSTRRETRGRRVPNYKIGARGIIAQQLDRNAGKDTTIFRRAHREARLAHKDGDHSHLYPFGTYKARALHGAPMQEEPPDEAIVTRPGPTLDEVKAELAKRLEHEGDAAAEERAHARRDLVDQVRDAFTDEAADVVAHDDIQMARIAQGPESTAEDSPGGPSGVEVRHLSSPRSRGRATPSRITVLRDRRRGRPKGSSSTQGSDPPA